MSATIIDFNITCPCGALFGEVHFESDRPHMCGCGQHQITRQGKVEKVPDCQYVLYSISPRDLPSTTGRSRRELPGVQRFTSRKAFFEHGGIRCFP